MLSNSPVLVKDINPTHFNALDIPEWTAYKGQNFFAATDGIHGIQLWKTDGTASGTVMVTDISSGPGSFYNGLQNGGYPYSLTVSQGLLFFVATDAVHGQTLWRSDGVPSGTFMVKDINVDRGPFDGSHYRGLVNFAGELYFFGSAPGQPVELWKTDGTDAGTVVVTTKGGTPNFYQPDLVEVGGTLYFAGSDNGLWKSDGTDAGTVEVATSPPDTAPTKLTDVNGTLYFTLANTAQLWKSDGTATGTVLVANINPNSFGRYNLNFLTNVNGMVFFAADDGTHGRQVWRSDGTAAGTFLLQVIGQGFSYPFALTAFNGKAFWSQDGLRESDGTSAGTILVKDIRVNPYGPTAPLTEAFGKLFFGAIDGTNGEALWESDGTTQGTVLFKDLNTNPNSPFPGADISYSAFINGTLYFGAGVYPLSVEPWKSDGTPAGTVQIAQINNRTFSSLNNTANFVAIDSTVYFAATVNGFGTQIWKSDGTSSGTVMVTNSALLGRAKTIKYLTDVGGTLFFVTTDLFGSSRDWSLWKSDGTAAGTVLVDDFGQFPYSRYYAPPLFNLTSAGHTLFFVSEMGGFGRELWSSDGTAAGTHVLNINPAPYAGSYPYGMKNIKGTLYFSANDGTHGAELWKSDGTVAGTVLVKDINTLTTYGFPHGSYPFGFTQFKGSIYFTANDGVHGYEIWKTDGTAAGTMLAVDIVPGFTSSYPGSLTKVGGKLFFSATDGLDPAELWKTDGTQAGTVKVADIEPGSGDFGVFSMVAFQGGVLFQVIDSTGGTEIWGSDGTAAGTVLLAKFPNLLGGQPSLQLTAVGSTAYFVVNDGVHGSELWQTDGTPAGTIITADLYPGPTGSNPHNLTNANGTLFFAANDFIHGYELFKIPPPGAAANAQATASRAAALSGLASSLGSTGINALLPATPPPTPALTGPPSVESKPMGPPTVGGARMTALSAALPAASRDASSMPSPEFGDPMGGAAVDALFAAIR